MLFLFYFVPIAMLVPGHDHCGYANTVWQMMFGWFFVPMCQSSHQMLLALIRVVFKRVFLGPDEYRSNKGLQHTTGIICVTNRI